MKKTLEIVYSNGGEIYANITTENYATFYKQNTNPRTITGPLLPITGENYYFTNKFADYFTKIVPATQYDNIIDISEINNINLCPEVNLWICLIALTAQERSNYEIQFAIDNIQQLKKVAEYYSLPYPISTETEIKITNAPGEILRWNLEGPKPIIPAGIKFTNGIASEFKVYTFPKDQGVWDTWMHGISYYNQGTAWEAGTLWSALTGGEIWPEYSIKGIGSRSTAHRIESTRADGVKFHYKYTKDNPDPITSWYAEELSEAGNVIRTKYYTSAAWLQKAQLRIDKPPITINQDLCPSVNYWLAKSYYDEYPEEEVYFFAENVNMIDSVAEYYNLPIPYNTQQKEILNTNPLVYRTRHFDILGQGQGNYLPVVTGSIVFLNNIPTKLLLYTFLRPWEFSEEIILPF
jgi:hypothetical protein